MPETFDVLVYVAIISPWGGSVVGWIVGCEAGQRFGCVAGHGLGKAIGQLDGHGAGQRVDKLADQTLCSYYNI